MAQVAEGCLDQSNPFYGLLTKRLLESIGRHGPRGLSVIFVEGSYPPVASV